LRKSKDISKLQDYRLASVRFAVLISFQRQHEAGNHLNRDG